MAATLPVSKRAITGYLISRGVSAAGMALAAEPGSSQYDRAEARLSFAGEMLAEIKGTNALAEYNYLLREAEVADRIIAKLEGKS